MTKRYKFGYIERFGRSEYETIEHRVYHIANGTRGNQRHHIDIQQAMGSGLDDVAQIAQQDNDGNSTNQTQRELVDKRHAPCHTIVLHEIYKEPVCNTNRLTKVKVGFDI